MALLVLLWLLWLFGTSVEFGDCVRKRKEYEAYKALHEEPLFIIKLFVRFHLNSVCTFHTVNAFNGVVTALAGIAVAGFTLQLRLSTDKMWLAGEKQIKLTRQSVKATTRAAEAAMLQAKALVAAERAIMTLNTSATNLGVGGFMLEATNTGRTRAHCKRCIIKIYDELPGASDWITGAVSSGELDSVFNAGVKGFIAAFGVEADTKHALGRLEYVDVFGQTHYEWFHYHIRKDNCTYAVGDTVWNRTEDA